MTELKSLKNPQRILTALMFIAVFITAVGPEALGQFIPFVPQAFFVGVVSVCAWFMTQYGADSRVKRAEDIKEYEILEVDDNGVED